MRELNHSPDWYREHCTDENAPPLVQAMLKNDMNFIGADYDSAISDSERIDTYGERWDLLQSGGDAFRDSNGQVFSDSSTVKAMLEVFQRELIDGSRPTDIFRDEPYSRIDGLISEHKITPARMRQFLKAYEQGEGVDEEPFKTVRRLMNESGVDAASIRHFVKWRGRRLALETRKRNKVEALKEKEAKKPIPPEDLFIDYGQKGPDG